MSDPQPNFTIDELKQVAYLLLGASAADLEYHEREIDTIVELLTHQAGEQTLAETLLAHMKTFDPHEFDLLQACAAIDASRPEKRAALLQMVLKVIDADEIRDLNEDSYLVKVATAIGASRNEYESLVLEITEGDAQPPPIPR